MMPVMPPGLPFDVIAVLYSYLNLFPASPYTHQVILPAFERLERSLVQKYGSITVYTGTYFNKGVEPDHIGDYKMWVPTSAYKVFVLPNGERKAFFFPNNVNSGFFHTSQYTMPVEILERMTGSKYD
jgi:DNA/RNA endonuclease G (NUC1)